MTLSVQPAFWLTSGASLLRIAIGFLLALTFGIALAAFMYRFPSVNDFFRPALAVVRSTPVSSFILLTILWFQETAVPVFIVFLTVLPIIQENVLAGIRNTDPQLLEMSRVFHLSRWKTVAKIYLPSIAPYLASACTTGLGFAWKSGIAAEVLCTPQFSIGRNLYETKLYLETPDLFAWTAFVILLSILFERAFSKIMRIGLKHIPEEARV
ncbi:MAG: ABC transporter permease subunit [Bacillota bacterium]